MPAGFAARPGQFVQILCRDEAATEAAGPYLRRPFSLAGQKADKHRTVLEVVYRVVGRGTAWLEGRAAGDRVDIIGPLGNGFTVANDCKEAFLVAGGVGHPPLMMLAHELSRHRIKRLAFYGARRSGLLPFRTERVDAFPRDAEPVADVDEWAACETPVVVSTDDGSAGFHGTVTEALETYVARNGLDPTRLCIYACGPQRMLAGLARQVARWRVACQVALETLMACGMGSCQSCVVRVRAMDAPDGWRYKLCCMEGPVFAAEEIIW
ncbi:MAG: dihydroorotate dehydrogenase electron transfer subunit [Phycisphaerales bacterium]|nr:MAG: dihydroorotate dehydrogenase electron transfer subunit [Phycisphaerales bacterium]